MTTPDRLPTPDLLAGDCVHGQTYYADFTGCKCKLRALDCVDCIDLALSRARDEGIEAAAQLAESISPACDHERANGDPGAGAMATLIEYRDAIRALKEDRKR